MDARRKWDHQDGVRSFAPIPSVERDDNNRAPSFLWRIGGQLDEPNLTTTRRILDFGHLSVENICESPGQKVFVAMPTADSKAELVKYKLESPI